MDLQLILPEIFLTLAALGLLAWDWSLPAEKKSVLCWAGIAVSLVALGLTFLPAITSAVAAGASDPSAMRLFGGSWIVDPMSLLMKRAFSVTAALVFLMSREYVDEMPRARGEFYVLGVLSLLGMYLCASVNDFMSMFVSLEVVTVSFFVLAAFRRERATSIEAGLKLLVIGSLSAGLMLYGIAFIYGATGTVFFDEIRTAIGPGVGQKVPFELIFGALLVFLGLGFKTSAVPLHVWVPDVYEGAPTPVTAYLSVGSKLAGFVLVIRVVQVFFAAGAAAAEISAFFALVAALTLLYGNLGAIPQTNVKRLMGYSSIGQCGYILIGIAASWTTGLSGALFYMSAYVVMNLAAFVVILLVSRATGSHDMEDWGGLARRSPMLGLAMAVSLLSLAGVPPFMGFFGKFMLLGSAIAKPELVWLGVIGLINVVIALFFYLSLLKRVYAHEPRVPTPIAVPTRLRLTLMIAIVVLIAGGVAPQLLERTTTDAAVRLGFPTQP